MKANDVVQPTSDLGLDDNVPSTVFGVKFTDIGKWLCKCDNGTHGLLVFKNEASATNELSKIKLETMLAKKPQPSAIVVELSFDEAREVAKARPLPVCCLILDWQEGINRYHYVR